MQKLSRMATVALAVAAAVAMTAPSHAAEDEGKATIAEEPVAEDDAGLAAGDAPAPANPAPEGEAAAPAPADEDTR